MAVEALTCVDGCEVLCHNCDGNRLAPPTPACELHAKYFANSVREDGLLTIATGGIIYTPGSAGTVQEVFQDYCQNHYGSVGPAAPMVFLGKDFWVDEVPAAPLVRQLARGREAERWILVTDDVDEAVEFMRDYTPRARPSTTSAPGSFASTSPGTSSLPPRTPLPITSSGAAATSGDSSTGQSAGSPTGVMPP